MTERYYYEGTKYSSTSENPSVSPGAHTTNCQINAWQVIDRARSRQVCVCEDVTYAQQIVGALNND